MRQAPPIFRMAVFALASLVIIDGDTVRDGAVTYRLLGFDAPETYYARCPSEKARGDAATARLTAIIGAARSVDLRLIHVRDKYQRELATLVIDGRDVADIMISDGLARAYHGGKRKGWCD